MKYKKMLIALVLCFAIALVPACQSKDLSDNKEKKTKNTEITVTFDEEEKTTESTETIDTTETTEEVSNVGEVDGDTNGNEAIKVLSEAEFTDGLSAETGYVFDITYDDSEHTLSGSMIAEVKNCSGDDWKQICFEDWTTNPNYVSRISNFKYSEFTNTSVIIDNTETEVSFVRGDDLSSMSFDLPTIVKNGDTVIVKTDFLIHIPNVEDRYGFSVKNGITRVTLGNALPVLALYKDGKWQTHEYINLGESFNSETAFYDVTFTCPSRFEVAMTGIPEVTDSTYHVTEAYVRDFTIMLASNHETYQEEYNGVLISVFGNSDLADNFPEIAEQTKSILDFYEEMIGPYPYNSVDVCLIDLQSAGGMEYPELVTVNSGEALSSPYVLAHELGHEWFYLLIGNDEYLEPWLDESFATYISFLYMQSIGEDISMYGGVLDDAAWDANRDYYTVDTKASDDFYVINAYLIGPTFLNRIHTEMGDDAFYAALKEIYDTFVYKQANTEDVLDIFRKHTDADLDPIITDFFK